MKVAVPAVETMPVAAKPPALVPNTNLFDTVIPGLQGPKPTLAKASVRTLRSPPSHCPRQRLFPLLVMPFAEGTRLKRRRDEATLLTGR